MKANNVEEYLGTLQSAMKESWKSHLKTNKYSKHIALNEFYDDVVDLVDDLIEEYQGLHGVVKDLKNILTTDEMDAREYLEELREMTKDGKKFFEEEELKSDIDSILSLIDKTLYKLKELKESGMKSLKDFLNESLVVEARGLQGIKDAIKKLCSVNNGISDLIEEAADIAYEWYSNEDNTDENTNYYLEDLVEMYDAAGDLYERMVVGTACGFIDFKDLLNDWHNDSWKQDYGDFEWDDLMTLVKKYPVIKKMYQQY